MSSDGTSLYVASRYDSAVAHFGRDPSTGVLTYVGCTTGDAESGKYGSGACAEIESATDEGTSSGLDSLRAVTLSPDGKWLYVASGSDDAIARFKRKPTSGALTYRDCITGRIESGPEPAGTGACAAIPNATSGGVGSGLNNLQALVMSADGESLYAASFGDDAVAHFDRNPSTGSLTYVDCISGETESAGACTQIASAEPAGANSGLDNLFSVKVGPEGESLYVAARDDDAVARFDRDPSSGALTYHGCITGETDSVGCAPIGTATADGWSSGLDSLRSLSLSPDGESLYAASRGDDAVSHFERDPTSGALTYRDCLTSAADRVGSGGTGACETIADATSNGVNSGLDSLFEITASPDARSLYAASRYDAAVARFDREDMTTTPPPDTTAPLITLTKPANGAAVQLEESVLADYACTDETGGSGLASCVGNVPDGTAIDTASVGSKTFTVNAADNAGNTATLTHDYSVVDTPPPPAPATLTVLTINPPTLTIGSGPTSVTIGGEGFVSGATVDLEGGKGRKPTVTGTNVSSSIEVTTMITVHAKAKATTWDVRVTNNPPDGPTAVLPNALEVRPPGGDAKANGSQTVKGPIKIKVGSSEAGTASATGKVIAKGGSKARSLTALAAKKKRAKFKLKPASKAIAAGATVTLKLKPKGGKKKTRKLVKLVKGGAKAKAKIKWTLTDLAGNSTSGKLVVKLKK